MSRSRRKTPKSGITKAESEKKDKQLANRQERRVNKQRIKQGEEPKEKRELSDIWCMDKDGKRYYDPNKYPDVMRK